MWWGFYIYYHDSSQQHCKLVLCTSVYAYGNRVRELKWKVYVLFLILCYGYWSTGLLTRSIFWKSHLSSQLTELLDILVQILWEADAMAGLDTKELYFGRWGNLCKNMERKRKEARRANRLWCSSQPCGEKREGIGLVNMSFKLQSNSKKVSAKPIGNPC